MIRNVEIKVKVAKNHWSRMTILWYLIFVIDVIKWGIPRDDRERDGERTYYF